MKVLVVVDMQRDFIDGSLGTKEAVGILPKVIEKVKNFQGKVFFTLDTHGEDYLESQEGENLPVIHCVKNTEGWRLPKELEELRVKKHAKSFEKPGFSSRDLAFALEKLAREKPIESIQLVGLCTDICVVSNALLIKAVLPETEIVVDASCCAGVTVEKHLAALETMRSCQIRVDS